MNNFTKNFPYIIHACPPTVGAYPTHTHGLTEIGMPEFIVDPLAFGPQGNGQLINDSYLYLYRPENTDALDLIMKGETVTINSKELDPAWSGEHNICFRIVGIDFEAVKQAYEGLDLEKIADVISFIQIYVEGDNFVLDDDYYRGGVTG
jgi:hypothetical protein